MWLSFQNQVAQKEHNRKGKRMLWGHLLLFWPHTVTGSQPWAQGTCWRCPLKKHIQRFEWHITRSCSSFSSSLLSLSRASCRSFCLCSSLCLRSFMWSSHICCSFCSPVWLWTAPPKKTENKVGSYQHQIFQIKSSIGLLDFLLILMTCSKLLVYFYGLQPQTDP